MSIENKYKNIYVGSRQKMTDMYAKPATSENIATELVCQLC